MRHPTKCGEHALLGLGGPSRRGVWYQTFDVGGWQTSELDQSRGDSEGGSTEAFGECVDRHAFVEQPKKCLVFVIGPSLSGVRRSGPLSLRALPVAEGAYRKEECS
jgi:hypothetical protein